VVVAVGVAGACSNGSSTPSQPTSSAPHPQPPAAKPGPLRLTTAPSAVVRLCRSLERKGGVPTLCPTILPAPPPDARPTRKLYLQTLGLPHYGGIDLRYGVPAAAYGFADPRSFVHFGLIFGYLARELIPVGTVRNLGERRFGRFRGDLVYDASISYFSHHLTFLFDYRGHRYIATLHAWRPFLQPEAALRAIVKGLRG
jgi:hypothetical protein